MRCFVDFDKIEDAVTAGEVDAGLLIHEGQLTYASNGLSLWVDLGEWWHGETNGLPLPLGCNVVRRDLGDELIAHISRDLRNSITHGLAHREQALSHAMQYARGLSEDDADTFVGMYVNDYTVDYGQKGRDGVRQLMNRASQAGLIPENVSITFVDDGT